MIHSVPRPPRPVIALSLRDDASEVEALADAAGLRVVEVVRQRRGRPDPATYLGAGKIKELREHLHPHPLFSGGRPLVVVADELRPTVVFNLEKELDAEVWDRIRVILEIFQRNAHVKEARLQVELARLRYDLPFVHEAIHRQKTGERAGYMGGGEMEARTYETHLRRRTKILIQELEGVKKQRRLRRAGRRRSGRRLVAIAGYTNGGKSSLLNALTGSEVTERQQVFSTLTTTTRRIHSTLHKRQPSDILLTDTVGFIEDLPPWLIDAFSSTLEEVAQADVVLLVADASEPPATVAHKIATALSILEGIHAPRRQVVLLNKSDLLDEKQRGEAQAHVAAHLRPDVPIRFVSARTGEGLPEVTDLLLNELLESRDARLRLDVTRADHARLESWLRDNTDILAADDEGTRRTLTVRCGLPTWGRLLHLATEARVHVQPVSSGS